MTVTTHAPETAAAAPAADGVPTLLDHLVGDPAAFFRDHWANQPVVLRAPTDLTGLISEQEIWDEVDCGLLSRPYFTVFNEGVRTAISDMSTQRTVVGHDLAGYIRPEQIYADFAAGGTFKFNQPEHWHPRIRELVQGMQRHFRGGLESFVFLSPPGKTAMRAHYDGAHVFVLQVQGVKDWTFGRIHPGSTSDSTIHEGPIEDEHRVEVTLRPGDVLYMPHGTPHFATAREGNSIHIAITVEEPTAENLANVLLASFMADPRFAAFEETHHRHPLPERTRLLREALIAHLAEADEKAVLDSAVTLRREHR
ncbi:JmjC domain-containing protein [Streptomyces sp. NPDC002886]|uniref:JmjC domain-containing protein n=1 Tax=Streptomyces sp. NPDC002886 TaxID=3364667 RepID=UPI00369A1FDD